MTNRPPPEADLRCVELVDGLTAYLDGAVDEGQRRRMNSHLAGCAGCSAALDQMRTTIKLAGRLTAADVASLDPLTRDRLETTLRRPRRK